MKKLIFILLTSLMVFTLSHCNGFNVPEEEPEVYTWEGYLFVEPNVLWANKTVYLLAYRQDVLFMSDDTLDQTKTDEFGYFSMSYEKFTTLSGEYNADGTGTSQSKGYIELKIAGPPIMRGAYNVNVDRFYCLNNRSFIDLHIKAKDEIGIDTVYLSWYQAADVPNDFIKIKNDLFAVPLSGAIDTNILIKRTAQSNFAFLPSSFELAYGKDKNALKDTLFNVTEWPQIDSVLIKI